MRTSHRRGGWIDLGAGSRQAAESASAAGRSVVRASCVHRRRRADRPASGNPTGRGIDAVRTRPFDEHRRRRETEPHCRIDGCSPGVAVRSVACARSMIVRRRRRDLGTRAPHELHRGPDVGDAELDDLLVDAGGHTCRRRRLLRLMRLGGLPRPRTQVIHGRDGVTNRSNPFEPCGGLMTRSQESSDAKASSPARSERSHEFRSAGGGLRVHARGLDPHEDPRVATKQRRNCARVTS